MIEFVIDIDHVWKKYPFLKDRPGFKEFFVNIHKFVKRKEEANSHFYALRDVTLRIKKGECVGIIGKNGAGKTTLLSLMLGTILPSKGRLEIMDRVPPCRYPRACPWVSTKFGGKVLDIGGACKV